MPTMAPSSRKKNVTRRNCKPICPPAPGPATRLPSPMCVGTAGGQSRGGIFGAPWVDSQYGAPGGDRVPQNCSPLDRPVPGNVTRRPVGFSPSPYDRPYLMPAPCAPVCRPRPCGPPRPDVPRPVRPAPPDVRPVRPLTPPGFVDHRPNPGIGVHPRPTPSLVPFQPRPVHRPTPALIPGAFQNFGPRPALGPGSFQNFGPRPALIPGAFQNFGPRPALIPGAFQPRLRAPSRPTPAVQYAPPPMHAQPQPVHFRPALPANPGFPSRIQYAPPPMKTGSPNFIGRALDPRPRMTLMPGPQKPLSGYHGADIGGSVAGGGIFDIPSCAAKGPARVPFAPSPYSDPVTMPQPCPPPRGCAPSPCAQPQNPVWVPSPRPCSPQAVARPCNGSAGPSVYVPRPAPCHPSLGASPDGLMGFGYR